MGNTGPLAESLPADVVELRLPTRPEYVSVLRGAAGVIAGEMSFDYDEVLHLRVAVSEAFLMAVSRVGSGNGVGELTVRFIVGATSLEVLIPAPPAHSYNPNGEAGMEHQGLLGTLVDQLDLGSGANGEPIVRIVKHKSGRGV